MAIVVPASDPVNFELQANIATIAVLIANTVNALNGPLIQKLTLDKANMQMQLVLGLLGQGSILAANVIANETYSATAQEGGDQL
jgi:hypothetical protein